MISRKQRNIIHDTFVPAYHSSERRDWRGSRALPPLPGRDARDGEVAAQDSWPKFLTSALEDLRLDWPRLTVDFNPHRSHLTRMPKIEKAAVELLRTWKLSPAATFGSSVRMKGILQEIQSRLPAASTKALAPDAPDLILVMPAIDKAVFNAAAAITPCHDLRDECRELPAQSGP